MATQKLTTLVPLKFGGKRLAIGEDFEASSVHARLLIALKKAKAAGTPAAGKPKPAAPVAKAPEPASTSTAVPGMTTQTYKTRDATPEK